MPCGLGGGRSGDDGRGPPGNALGYRRPRRRRMGAAARHCGRGRRRLAGARSRCCPRSGGSRRDAEPSLGIKLLADLKTLFDASTLDAMPTEVILSRLTELPESPWGDLGAKPINDRKLGRRLREYGVKSRAIRVGDKTPRGYLREDLQDAWLRYLPALDA